MTPLEIKILLHYYCSPIPWPGYNGNKNITFQQGLVSIGLLRETDVNDHGGQYALTERGKAYCEQLQSMPLPVQIWVHPDKVNQQEKCGV